jgi:7-cyano-7-deazaguanine reductase
MPPRLRAMPEPTRTTEFVALGHAGSEHYAGLETFPSPGVASVQMTSDELVAVCPITGQPDFYPAEIEYRPERLCLESKSLKLYLATYRNEGVFCEALAVRIRDDVAATLELPTEKVHVSLTQKARGGITIRATV